MDFTESSNARVRTRAYVLEHSGFSRQAFFRDSFIVMQQLSAEDFLDRLQQLILNTAMNSTYKLALIMALTDAALATASRPDAQAAQDGMCRIPLEAVAVEFLRIYWPQQLDYPSPVPGVKPRPLVQNFNFRDGLKRRDKVFTDIDEALTAARKVLPEARLVTFDQFSRAAAGPLKAVCGKLMRECVALLKKNPLTYIKPDADFLFALDKNDLVLAVEHVRLLQRFRPIINELAQSRWVSHLRSIKSNSELLGQAPGDDTLREFLFNPVRGDELSAIRNVLVPIQGLSKGKTCCFYCGEGVDPSHAQVDHFLPFTRYSHTRIFNFVLACPSCNASKSNWLVDAHHVERWMRRNEDRGDDLLAAARGIAPAGGLEVADMALTLYSLAGSHAEPLWTERGKGKGRAAGAHLSRKAHVIEHDIIPLLEQNRSNMSRLAAEAPAAFFV